MKFAFMTEAVPGQSLAEKCDRIAASGCTGVETIIFPSTPLEAWQTEFQTATATAGIVPAAVIVGGLKLHQPESLAWARDALPAIAEVGAAAMLTAEYQTQDPLPLFPPYPLPSPAEQTQVDRAMDDISALAESLSLDVYLEPITQFETRFWREVAPVLDVCERLQNPRVKLCLDFHNMNITEADIFATMTRADSWIGHIHLADNNRRLPGEGHIDFAAGLDVLTRMAYDGWFTFECGVLGDFKAQVQQSIRWLESLRV